MQFFGSSHGFLSLPVRVLCPEFLLFFYEFFNREVCRHADTAVLVKDTALKIALALTCAADAIRIRIVIMVNLWEILFPGYFQGFLPRRGHRRNMSAEVKITAYMSTCRSENKKE